jgi:hypothetical protein
MRHWSRSFSTAPGLVVTLPLRNYSCSALNAPRVPASDCMTTAGPSRRGYAQRFSMDRVMRKGAVSVYPQPYPHKHMVSRIGAGSKHVSSEHITVHESPSGLTIRCLLNSAIVEASTSPGGRRRLGIEIEEQQLRRRGCQGPLERPASAARAAPFQTRDLEGRHKESCVGDSQPVVAVFVLSASARSL